MDKAWDQGTTDRIRKLSEDLAQLGWYHSIELRDGTIIPGLIPVERLRARLAQFSIPEDLTGKRVLDIGAWDGFYSFEMERRGATVVAVDSTKQKTFLQAKQMLDSKVEYHVADVCKLSPRDFGYFDIVLFFGVLYHVKHPILALENVCALTTDIACVESYVTDDPPDSSVPLMEFYEGTEFSGQFDNWVGPNTACLLAFCRTVGFARVGFHSVVENRGHVTCYRKWPDVERKGEAPELFCVQNSIYHNHDFSHHRDDYLTVYFNTPQADLDCDNVFVQVGPYGSRPVIVSNTGGICWQANCKLPLGLVPGWYDVSVSVRDSAWSARARIAIDLSLESRRSSGRNVSETLSIMGAADGLSWDSGRVKVGLKSCVSAWVKGLPDGTSMYEVSLRLDGTDLPAVFVPGSDTEAMKQVNALLPPYMEPGEYLLSVRVRDIESQQVPIQLVTGA